MKSNCVLSLAVVAGLCGLPQGTGAWAQAPSPAQPAAALSVARGQPTRVVVNFRIEIDGEAGDLAAEKARKSLYGQAVRECSVLTASFSGTNCVMENLNVMFQRDNSMNRGVSFLNGNATYQLRAD